MAEDLEQACTLGQLADRPSVLRICTRGEQCRGRPGEGRRETGQTSPYISCPGEGKRGTGQASPYISCLQLFRRVASALPGMENVQEKSKEGSILFLYHVSEKMAPQAEESFSSVSR